MKEYPYWWDTVQVSSTKSQVLSLPPSVDVVVVGAGYTGLAAARVLGRAGASVLVVERESIGWGASSRNGGQVLAGLKVDPATLVRRYGRVRARRLFDVETAAIARLETIVADEEIDCGFARVGHIQAAVRPGHFAALRAEAALLADAFDHRVTLVPRDGQRAEIGTDAFHGLSVDEHSAALNPARFVEGLAAAAVRAGAGIAAGTAVRQVRRNGDRWTVATTRGGLDARDVLFATNGYTDGAAPMLQRRFIPIGSYIVATEPLSAAQAAEILPRNRVAFDSRNFLHYFRLSADRRLLFGGRAEFSSPDAGTMHRVAAILKHDLAAVFPQLAGVAIEYVWGGRVAFTRDQMPRAGKLDGLYYAGGYCGHGIAMATHLGEQIARRIAGEAVDEPLFDDRFPAIPLYGGRPWFLPMVGAYYKVKDWIQ